MIKLVNEPTEQDLFKFADWLFEYLKIKPVRITFSSDNVTFYTRKSTIGFHRKHMNSDNGIFIFLDRIQKSTRSPYLILAHEIYHEYQYQAGYKRNEYKSSLNLNNTHKNKLVGYYWYNDYWSLEAVNKSKYMNIPWEYEAVKFEVFIAKMFNLPYYDVDAFI